MRFEIRRSKQIISGDPPRPATLHLYQATVRSETSAWRVGIEDWQTGRWTFMTVWDTFEEAKNVFEILLKSPPKYLEDRSGSAGRPKFWEEAP